MRFLVNRASIGVTSKNSPCPGALRGPESSAWPGEYQWFIDLNSLEELAAFLNENGGLGLFAPEDGDDYPGIEIYDETDQEP